MKTTFKDTITAIKNSADIGIYLVECFAIGFAGGLLINAATKALYKYKFGN